MTRTALKNFKTRNLDDVKKATRLLRFHTVSPAKSSLVYATYANIARALNITYN